MVASGPMLTLTMLPGGPFAALQPLPEATWSSIGPEIRCLEVPRQDAGCSSHQVVGSWQVGLAHAAIAVNLCLGDAHLHRGGVGGVRGEDLQNTGKLSGFTLRRRRGDAQAVAQAPPPAESVASPGTEGCGHTEHEIVKDVRRSVHWAAVEALKLPPAWRSCRAAHGG